MARKRKPNTDALVDADFEGSHQYKQDHRVQWLGLFALGNLAAKEIYSLIICGKDNSESTLTASKN